jgi:hypothetical protein
MKIKHTKYKNTGILFELLVRQITADTLKGGDSPAIDILKKYFVKSELSREYRLYESILKSKNLSESYANVYIETTISNSKHLNRSVLKKQKYNLINEIKQHYDLVTFFGSQISDYKTLASIYTLMESTNLPSPNNEQLIHNKINLLEHLTNQKSGLSKPEDEVLKEFATYDKDLRSLTYRILLEKFNEKYDSLDLSQKQVLKEYINSVDSAPGLRDFYNSKIGQIGTKEFGHLLVGIAAEYNNAMLVIENANIGWATIQVAIDRQYANLYYSQRKCRGESSKNR